MAIPGGGKKPGAVAADFDPNKVAGFVEGHFLMVFSFRKKLPEKKMTTGIVNLCC